MREYRLFFKTLSLKLTAVVTFECYRIFRDMSSALPICCLIFLTKFLKSHQSKLTTVCTFPAPLTEVDETRTGPGISFFTVLKCAHIILNILSLSASTPLNF